MKPLTLSLRWFLRKWLLLIVLILALLLIGAFLSLRQPDLELWHHDAPKGEFRAQDYGKDYTLAEYLELEKRLFAQLNRYAVNLDESPQYSRFIRYIKDGPNTPDRFTQNWNKTSEFIPKEIKGGVLLIHGLSDSPYSMRSMGEIFLKNGFYALSIRLPGHGTVPAALVDVSWKDWYAVAAMGARHVTARIGDKGPFYICGYSAGGALALKYTANQMMTEQGRAPDGLVLFSPAIGITGIARVSNAHKSFSWIPYFEKYKWVDIKTEIEPFKYTSFPNNGGAQMWDLAVAVHEGIDRLINQGRMNEFPPILTFQSVVDATTRVVDVVEKLYNKLPANSSELVAFDINRLARFKGLFAVNPEAGLKGLQESGRLPYRLTVITNKEETGFVVAKTTAPFSNSSEEMPTGLQWPAGVYSLSHVAIPFPPDDPLYGTGPVDPEKETVRFGRLFAKGEKKVLHISADDLIRMRYNPFFNYMEDKVQTWIEAGSEE